LTLLTLFSLLVSAAPGPIGGPLAVVQAADAEVERLLATKQGGGAAAQLAAKAEQYIDFGELARRALGPDDWNGLSRGQREAFTGAMKGVLRASYAQKALGDGRGGAKVSYGAETVEGGEATVATVLDLKEGPIPVVYKLFRSQAGWRIYDVITDDVSLVSTYHDQFRKVITRSGFEGLLRSLKARQAQLEHGSPPAKAK
jgi:phospholipid transport system substrate-binding protein